MAATGPDTSIDYIGVAEHDGGFFLPVDNIISRANMGRNIIQKMQKRI